MNSNEKNFDYAIIIASDSRSTGEKEDKCIEAIKNFMPQNYRLVYKNIVADEKELIKKELIDLSEKNIPLILTSGGTGFSKRDVTPEATREVVDRLADGVSEAIRLYSKEKTKNWFLSRNVSGIRNNSLIINLAGSPKAAVEGLEAIIEALSHGLDVLVNDYKHD